MTDQEPRPVWVRDIQEEWIVIRLAVVLAVIVLGAVAIAVWWW